MFATNAKEYGRERETEVSEKTEVKKKETKPRRKGRK
jgi:hypothetical protein